VSPMLWVLFAVLVLGILAFDLGVLARRIHLPSAREALARTAFFIVLSLAFAPVVWWLYEHHDFGAGSAEGLRGADAMVAYLTAWLLEQSLSLDNIFVMALIFGYFRVPSLYRQRVLFWGILGALVLRFVMIVAGAAAVRRFHWIIYVFGAVLVASAIKMLFTSEERLDPDRSLLVRAARRLIPITREYHEQHFFVRSGGRLSATPLLLALIMIEGTDVMFAVDSIPAAFAVTSDPFLVFTSNVFAILGLRSLYFALEGLMHRFKYLKVSLMLVLLYVGVKMLASHYVKIPNPVSLLVIVTTLVVGVFASMARAEAPIAATAAIPVKVATWARRNVRRVVMLVIGGTVLLTGLVMLAAPGPGILVIVAGSVILAAEFAWARRLLKRTRDGLSGIKANTWGRLRRKPDRTRPPS
jgi:tellurite resistance protein TerC